MQSTSIPKYNRIIFGIIFGIMGFVFLSFLISSSLQIATNENFFNLMWWGYGGILSIIFIECGLLMVRQGTKMNESKLVPSEKNSFTVIAKIFNFFSLAFLFVLIIFVLGFFSIGPLQSIFNQTVDVTQQFYAIIIAFVIYLILRWPLKILFSKMGKFFAKNLPKYDLYQNGITLDLNMKNLTDSSKKYLVTIQFKEIDELKEMSYFEAEALLKNMGPNVSLQAQWTKGEYQYAKGDISKPPVWIRLYGGGPVLLIKGKNLFYLLTVSNQDTRDLFDAYNSFKNKV